MGEAFKRMRAAAFQHQQHRHYQALVDRDLISMMRPSETRFEVTCALTNPNTGLVVGSRCLVRQNDNGDCDVVHGNIVIARLPPEARATIDASRASGPSLQDLLPCRVSSIGAFGAVSLELEDGVTDAA